MFNVGFTELLLVGVIALIFIGPQQLPELARTIGRLLNEFKRATSDIQSTITSNITDEFQTKWDETRADIAHQELIKPTSVESLPTEASNVPAAADDGKESKS